MCLPGDVAVVLIGRKLGNKFAKRSLVFNFCVYGNCSGGEFELCVVQGCEGRKQNSGDPGCVQSPLGRPSEACLPSHSGEHSCIDTLERSGALRQEASRRDLQ